MDGACIAERKKTLFDIPQHFFHPVAEHRGG
jgi:hypothetical protein